MAAAGMHGMDPLGSWSDDGGGGGGARRAALSAMIRTGCGDVIVLRAGDAIPFQYM